MLWTRTPGWPSEVIRAQAQLAAILLSAVDNPQMVNAGLRSAGQVFALAASDSNPE